VNLFFLKTIYTYVKICQEQAGASDFSRKNRSWGQNGQNMQIWAKFLKIGIFEPPKKFFGEFIFPKIHLCLCKNMPGTRW